MFGQFGLLLSLALRLAFFALVASYSYTAKQSKKKDDLLFKFNGLNDMVGIVLLTVIMVFVAVVVDRLVKYRCVCDGPFGCFSYFV